MGYDYTAYRDEGKVLSFIIFHNKIKIFKIVKKIPFSSERKKMITVHKFSNLKYFVYVKGATELLIEKCSGMLTDKKMIL